MGGPVEIEWALDETGFKLLQSRPLIVEPRAVADEIWLKHPGLNWASRRHRLGRRTCRSCQLRMRTLRASRRATCWSPRVAGPALTRYCRASPAWSPSLAARHRIWLRSRASAAFRWCSVCSTQRGDIPDGSQVAVDGVAGVVRWMRLMRPRIFVTQPVAKSAIARLRKVATVRINPDASRIIFEDGADCRRAAHAISSFRSCTTASTATVIAANPQLRAIASQSITPDNIDVAEATAPRNSGHGGAANRGGSDRRSRISGSC